MARKPNEDSAPVENLDPPSNDLVTEGQKNDPATAGPLDKNGPADGITAPGEAIAGEKKVNVKATGSFLVYDPYTLDCVGPEGGEMRLTTHVREALEAGKLEEI